MAANPKPLRELERALIVAHCARLGLHRHRRRRSWRDLRRHAALSGQYILRGGFPVKAPNLLVWALWFEDRRNVIVCSDYLLDGSVHVSTVFLGLDYGFGKEHEPVLYETMIFGGDHGGYQVQYCTRRQARQGHKEAIELAFTVPA